MIRLLVLTTMPLGGSTTQGFSSKSRIPCQSLTASQPGAGMRPWLVWSGSRRGAAPAICIATDVASAIVMFSDGARWSRAAARASPTERARISAIAAPTEPSSALSPSRPAPPRGRAA